MVIALALSCFFLVLFLLFRSNDYTAVDGALRCLSVFQDRHLLFHRNNHLLYPFWVSLWARLSEALGISTSNAFEFIRVIQAMNGFLAAGTIALLYGVLRILTSARFAVFCALLFAFSAALLEHATNSAEPLTGLFFTMIGVTVLLAGLRRNSRTTLVLAGCCFAVAVASYQAMAASAGIYLLICTASSVFTEKAGIVARHTLINLSFTGLGALAGVCLIYGVAYSHQGIPAAEMPGQLFELPGSKVYGGFTAARVASIPFGFIRNSLGVFPPDYKGIRSLLQHRVRIFWLPIVTVSVLWMGVIAVLVVKACGRMLGRSRAPWLMTGACLALLLLPLAYWDPLYDKLWLLPLAVAVSLLAISLRPKVLNAIDRRLLLCLAFGVLMIEIGVNLPGVFRRHAARTPYLSEAQELNQLLAPNDWIVLDYDGVSVLWHAIWGKNIKSLSLPDSTPAQAREWLDFAREDAARGDAKILFVGVLDESKEAWDVFLGSRVGFPFSFLEEYRTHAAVLKDFSVPGGTVTLRQYKPRPRSFTQ